MSSFRTKILVGIFGVLVLGVFVATRMVFIRIPVGGVGVRTNIVGSGLVLEDFGPGWHPNIIMMHQWAEFDATVQTLELSKTKFHHERGGPSLSLKSADGYNVEVDVTIKYRIKEGEAHKLLMKKGPGDAYKRTFMQNALDACRITFGQMDTEGFYDPDLRVQKSAEAKVLLQQRVDDLSVEVIKVLIRDVTFDASYEKKIRDRKLADQDVLLNKSKAKAAEQKGITQTIEADTDAIIQKVGAEKKGKLVQMQAELRSILATIRAEAVTYESEKKSQADLLKTRKLAEGQLLLKIAEAEGERLRNEALAGAGGRIMTALEAVKSINLDEITVSTQQIDFLDIKKMLEKFGISESDFDEDTSESDGSEE